MENWILLALQSALIPTVFSIIASAMVSWLTSERWVEKSRLRREHSITLKDTSIKSWINKIDEMCPLTTEYDHNYEKVFGEDSHSYEILPYGDFIESHMKSGYPLTHEIWEEYKLSTEICVEGRAKIFEDIRIEFERYSKELGIVSYYPRPGMSGPKLFIKPHEIAEAILAEKENRMKGFDYWHYGKLSSNLQTVGDRTYTRVTYSDLELMILNEIDATRVGDKILEILEDPNYHKRFVKLYMEEREIMTKKRVFIGELGQIIEYIELGHNIRGHCDACSHGLRASIRRWLNERRKRQRHLLQTRIQENLH